jgi:cytochrome c oxidase subunit 1
MNNISNVSYLKHQGKFKGILGWFTSTDHKRIGLMYLYALGIFFLIGGLIGVFMRIELIAPGETIMSAQTYNSAFSVHGIIMIFLVVIPGLAATFGNIMMPIMIGARDVAFPKLNLLSLWIYFLGAMIAVYALFADGTPPDSGWTFYAPYSTETGSNVISATLAAFVLGFSSILTGLNFIVTIHRMRAPGMTWFKMPLFPWSIYATAWIQVLATPVVGITLLMLIAERLFKVGFFNPALGGDPILFEHLFWIYSHPAVYIMILPAMGVISEIIPTFCQRKVFGYKAIALSSLAIAAVGYLVWGHHMYTSGMSNTARWLFSFLTFIVAIPSAIKVFNWITTMYKGSISITPPFMYSLSFLFLFMVGGLTGLILGSLATDVHVHDTAFVVAHFHYIIFGGVGFAFFAALHYWYPKIWGRMYDFKIAYWGWALTFIGFNTLYFPLFVIGMQGMPRRYFDYLPQFHAGHFISTMGAFIIFIGLVIMFTNLFRSARRGKPAEANPWNGLTLEWTIPSPPPVENFDEIPTITNQPYNYQ